ncbi:MAG: single-stranded-DNA-specific exonuclease RecJ [Anaerolineales bacterium]
MKGNNLNKRWILPQRVKNASTEVLSDFSKLESQILANRGIHSMADAEMFLSGKAQEAADPYLLEGMKPAVHRLEEAIDDGENIVIYGDYDADGVTATALLVEYFSALGGNVTHYIPDRFREGYGLNRDALDRIKAKGADLVVTVDCGIRALEEIRHANELGLDVIVTDHHEPGPSLPQACSVIDPKQENDEYPFKGLAGVGIAYKLTEAISRKLGTNSHRDNLDLVAIGTIADMAPLISENRIMVREGLRVIRSENRLGIVNLCREAGYEIGRVDATKIGFGIGPRINAAGRVDSAEHAFRLLVTTDDVRSRELATSLEQLNQKRRTIMRQSIEKARQLGLDAGREMDFIFVADESFSEGIIGLVASRLVDEFYRPAIVAVKGERSTRASGRSVPEFHITNALERCADLLERFGGHSAAAGFSVANENLDELEARLREIASSQLSGIELRPAITLDAVVGFEDLDWKLQEFIERIEPCGEGNPVPQFAAANTRVLGKRQVGKDGTHLKLTLKQGGKVFDAIAFRKGELYSTLPEFIDIAFKLERSDYWNTPSLELNISDIKEAGSIDKIG